MVQLSSAKVQMVSEREQFTDPALLDLNDAERTSTIYKRYLER